MFLIDVRDILKAGGRSKQAAFFVSAQDCDIESQDCVFTELMDVHAELTNINGVIRAKGRVCATYETCCAYCLEPLHREIVREFDEEYVSAGTERDADEAYVYAMQGKEIDMAEVLHDAVLLEIPIRHLCREDCKSLCPQCGKNLNEGDCGCGQNAESGQFDALKDFFQ